MVWCVPSSDGEEYRGGVPARRFRSVTGGPLQTAFYGSAWTLEFLGQLTTPTIVRTGVVGTYSYYTRPGDFLALHRDIIACDVALITCLRNDDGAGGGLCMYPERIAEPLSAIRATPEHGAVIVHLQAGQTIVLYGGLLPHALLPLTRGQTRIVSVLCYQIS